DIFHLTVEQLAELERMGAKSAGNLVAAIQASKRPTLARFIYGLGIPQVGEHVAELLAEHFGSIDALSAADEEALTSVREIGPETAREVRAFFQLPQNRETLARLERARVEPQTAPRRAHGGPLRGKTFVITGVLSAPRESVIERIEAAGGKVTGGIS